MSEEEVREAVVEAVRAAFVAAADDAMHGKRMRPNALADWLLDFGQDRVAAIRRGQV